MKAILSALILGLTMAATSAFSAPSNVDGILTPSIAAVSFNGETAALVFRSMTGAQQTGYAHHGQRVTERRGPGLYCMESVFSGVGTTTTHQCYFTVNARGQVVGERIATTLPAPGTPNAPIFMNGLIIASPVGRLDVINVRIQGNGIAQMLFRSLTQAPEQSMFGGDVIYRNGAQFSCVATRNSRLPTMNYSYECLFHSDRSGAVYADNVMTTMLR